jgi:aerobic carbon-monoxide dehydrogenase large subunit
MDNGPGKLVGRRVRRVEDRRFLLGRGAYVADYLPPGTLHAAFFRSEHAHARIIAVDTAAARVTAGVMAVLTGQEMAALARPMVAASTMSGYKVTPIPPLASEVVRYVGEPIAAIVAESRYLAEDALERISVEYEPLDVAADVEGAAGRPLVHDEAGTNVLVTREFTRGSFEKPSSTDVVIKQRFRFHRHAAIAIEPRGCLGEFNPGSGELTLHSATQCPGIVRSALAQHLDIPEHLVRVIAIDVGGGFGAKSSVYPEEIAVAAISQMLARPVRWISDRREDLLATSQGWDEIIDAELRLGADGTIVALEADIIGDVGAYSVYPWTAVIEPIQVASFIPGPYRVPNYRARARAVASNKAPAGPYRGVGRPPAVFAMESLIERAARRLGIDPIELRMRNYVRAEEFPYRTPVGIVWDRAGFVECMTKAREEFGYEAARAEQERARGSGRLVGIGFASYVELTGIGSATPAAPGSPIPAGAEAAAIRVDPTGTVTAIFGLASHGQGLETTLAQVVADELEVPLKDVRVRFGDTAFTPYGTGSYASRGAVLGGGAATLAARAVRDKARRIAAHLLETDPASLDAYGGEPWARAASERRLTLRDIAQAAYSGAKRLPRGMEPGLEATVFYDPYYGTATPATHAVMLEIDRETWAVKILRYVAVDDCGRVINPLIVDGQVHGGVAQGVGGALLEEVVYNESGQLLTGTLMDYLVPSAPEIPNIETHHLEIESRNSLGGFRGVGESGTIGAPAAIANAIADALSPFKIEPAELPLTPDRIFRLCRDSVRES